MQNIASLTAFMNLSLDIYYNRILQISSAKLQTIDNQITPIYDSRLFDIII